MPLKLFIATPAITPPETIAAMREAAKQAGFEAVFAADAIPENLTGTPNERTKKRFRAICDRMKECDAMMANITPFLGVEPDPDVIFQLGYMAAQQKPVFSYTNVSKPFYERVRDWNGKEFETDFQTGESGNVAVLKRDVDRMRIENMGIKDYHPSLKNGAPDNYNNLMLEGPSTLTGSNVLTPALAQTHVPENKLYSDLSVFAASLADARQQVIVNGKRKADPAPVKLEDSDACYIAGPDVFLPDLIDHFAAKKEIMAKAGIKGIAPIDAQMDFGEMQTHALGNGNNPYMRRSIYEADTGVMQSVRSGVFNLTPHHGVAGDSGTIFEMGYMTGKDDQLGRRPMVFAYSNEGNNLNARISLWQQNPQGPSYGATQAMGAFDYGTIFSPMIDGAILESGGTLTNRLGHAAAAELDLSADKKYAYLGQFSHAVREAAMMKRVGEILQAPGSRRVG